MMSILNKAVEESDRTLAILGAIFALALTVWLVVTGWRPIYVTTGLIALLACIAYLVIRKYLSPSTLSSLSQLQAKPSVYLILNVLFFSLFTYSMLSVYLSPEIYVRPLAYFISIAFMAALLALEILFLPSRKASTYLVLLKVILISLSLEWSQQLIFPSVVGIDPWWHLWFTTENINAGRIVEGTVYSNLPLFHLIIGETSLITNLGYRIATMLSVSLPQVIIHTLFIFLLGRFILGTKIGLLAALLLGIADWHVRFGFWATPTTFAAILLPAIIYLLFNREKQHSIAFTSLALVLMGTVILSHSVTSACIAVFLLLSWLGFEAYQRMYGQKSGTPVSLYLASLFLVGMFGWWMYASGYLMTQFARMIEWGFAREVVTGYVALPTEVLTSISRISFGEQLLNSLAFFLFWGFSFIGSFYLLSKRFGNKYSFLLALSGSVLLAMGFFGLLIGRSVLDERWWHFAQILLAIPVAVALLLIAGIFKPNWVKAAVLAIATVGLSFLMVISPTVNLDNRTLSPNTGVRYALTQSEMQSMNTFQSIWNGELATDNYFGLPIIYPESASVTFVSLSKNLARGSFTECDDMLVVIREEIVEHTFGIGGGAINLDYDPREVLEEQRFSKIYDCGSVSAFLKLNDGAQ